MEARGVEDVGARTEQGASGPAAAGPEGRAPAQPDYDVVVAGGGVGRARPRHAARAPGPARRRRRAHRAGHVPRGRVPRLGGAGLPRAPRLRRRALGEGGQGHREGRRRGEQHLPARSPRRDRVLAAVPRADDPRRALRADHSRQPRDDRRRPLRRRAQRRRRVLPREGAQRRARRGARQRASFSTTAAASERASSSTRPAPPRSSAAASASVRTTSGRARSSCARASPTPTTASARASAPTTRSREPAWIWDINVSDQRDGHRHRRGRSGLRGAAPALQDGPRGLPPPVPEAPRPPPGSKRWSTRTPSSGPAPSRTWSRERSSGPNWIAVGEAAFVVDAILSSGFTMSLRTGFLASDIVEEALAKGAAELSPLRRRIYHEKTARAGAHHRRADRRALVSGPPARSLLAAAERGLDPVLQLQPQPLPHPLHAATPARVCGRCGCSTAGSTASCGPTTDGSSALALRRGRWNPQLAPRPPELAGGG